jgi:hypothetical protein
MFENLSQREKILSLTVLSLLPISVIFMGAMWFIGKYNDNNREMMALEERISNEENKTLLARKAEKRLDYYQEASLASDYSPSRNQYMQWLRDQMRAEGLTQTSVNPTQSPALKHQNKDLGQIQEIKIAAEGDLQQIVNFLISFYSVDTLHRIKSIRLLPESVVARGGGRKIRTGQLKMNMDIELLILADAFGSLDFTQKRRELQREQQEYLTQIVGRNIFGPPNNAPSLSLRPASSYTSYEEVSLVIRGEDADKDDQLTFELVASEIEGAELSPNDGRREARLVVPGQPAGTYKFSVRVVDSGFPSKDDQAEFEIVFKDRANQKPTINIANLEPSYAPDRTIEILLEGRDRDTNDLLVFELLEGPEGARLVENPDKPRETTLVIPGLDVGQYEAVVSLSDGREEDGEKPIEQTLKFKVERKFSHLQETRITSILRETSGEWVVNVRVRTLGQRHSLKEGESFRIEGQQWTVESITPDEAIFRVGNQLKTFKTNTPFATPIRTESFASEDGDEGDQQTEASADSKAENAETGTGRSVRERLQQQRETNNSRRR